jgi:hypothetical protein
MVRSADIINDLRITSIFLSPGVLSAALCHGLANLDINCMPPPDDLANDAELLCVKAGALFRGKA